MRVFSFSYRYGGAPRRGKEDLVVDCRVLTNPYVHGKTGLDPEVRERVLTPRGLSLAQGAIDWGREHPDGTILVGCTFGRHRSVAIAEHIAKCLGVKAEHTSRRMREGR